MTEDALGGHEFFRQEDELWWWTCRRCGTRTSSNKIVEDQVEPAVCPGSDWID